MICSRPMRYLRGNPVGQTKVVLSIKKGKICEEQAYFYSCKWKFSWEDVRLQVTIAILKITERAKSSRKADRYLPTPFLVCDKRNFLLVKLLFVIGSRKHPNEAPEIRNSKFPTRMHYFEFIQGILHFFVNITKI